MSISTPATNQTVTAQERSFVFKVFKSIRQFPMLYLGALIVLALIVCAVFAPEIAHYPYQKQFMDGLTQDGQPHPPNAQFIWGADEVGRDVYSRVIYGSRVSLTVGVFSTAISLLIGTVLGLISGYFGGFIDMVIMRLTDTVLAFPFLIFCMALVAILSPSEKNVLFAIGVLGWGTMARVVRGQVLAVKEFEYVQAARAIGASSWRIMFVALLPNIFGPVMVLAALNVGSNIILESGLSYLGIGVQQPVPSWGNMIAEGLQTYQFAPWMLWAPGIALVIAVLGFNLLADGLRDILDPRNVTR
ncbi:ABC transporter permease [Alicyclobacillus acidiphilus]|uniref:ABC transporter permease n=1 Tax=Alicyclobacillus acidiphilus TaxID=182455 RepID=UPI000830C45E|nr:ABC transporter permease [Alicyclobacillus acidiphilus]